MTEIVSAVDGRTIEFVDAKSTDNYVLSGTLCSLDFYSFIKIVGQWLEIRETPTGVQVGTLIPGRIFGA
jgi:hypothetical protein